MCRIIPNLPSPDILGRPLLEKQPDLLQLAASRARIVEQVAELRRVGFDGQHALLEARVAFEDEDLMFRPARLADGIHRCGRTVGRCLAKRRLRKAGKKERRLFDRFSFLAISRGEIQEGFCGR